MRTVDIVRAVVSGSVGSVWSLEAVWMRSSLTRVGLGCLRVVGAARLVSIAAWSLLLLEVGSVEGDARVGAVSTSAPASRSHPFQLKDVL